MHDRLEALELQRAAGTVDPGSSTPAPEAALRSAPDVSSLATPPAAAVRRPDSKRARAGS